MDSNVKDVLLVLLGAVASLLGTALTNYFQLRRDHILSIRERKIRKTDELINYLQFIVKSYSSIASYLTGVRSEITDENELTRKILDFPAGLQQHSVHGLPSDLLFDNMRMCNQYDHIVLHALNLQKAYVQMTNASQDIDAPSGAARLSFASQLMRDAPEINNLIKYLERSMK